MRLQTNVTQRLSLLAKSENVTLDQDILQKFTKALTEGSVVHS